MDRKERLTHPRVNGIKSGFWSPVNKEELVQRLAEYEELELSPREIRLLMDRKLWPDDKAGWISVETRLPETFQSVIVCRESKQAIKTTSVEEGMRIADGWWKVFGARTKSVTHWMPLPDPPED